MNSPVDEDEFAAWKPFGQITMLHLPSPLQRGAARNHTHRNLERYLDLPEHERMSGSHIGA
jgi:hypothetical protein